MDCAGRHQQPVSPNMGTGSHSERLMHGIVLKGFKDFVIMRFDRETWRAIQADAGLEGKLYVPVTEYPDDEVRALLKAAVSISNTPANELLEAFGEFLLPSLLETYGVHVDDQWSALELIANVEEYIHTSLRAKAVAAYTPPQLQSDWIDDSNVRIVYRSERTLCAFARGLISGIGTHRGEQLTIEERACMHNGDPQCVLVVSRRHTP